MRPERIEQTDGYASCIESASGRGFRRAGPAETTDGASEDFALVTHICANCDALSAVGQSRGIDKILT